MYKLKITYKQWMEGTNSGIMHPRSKELKELDKALQSYEQHSGATLLNTLVVKLCAWLDTKILPNNQGTKDAWRYSTRNSKGMVEKLLFEISSAYGNKNPTIKLYYTPPDKSKEAHNVFFAGKDTLLLRTILNNSNLKKDFYDYAKMEYSSENIDAWQKLDNWLYSTPRGQGDQAFIADFWNDYIKTPNVINLPNTITYQSGYSSDGINPDVFEYTLNDNRGGPYGLNIDIIKSIYNQVSMNVMDTFSRFSKGTDKGNLTVKKAYEIAGWSA